MYNYFIKSSLYSVYSTINGIKFYMQKLPILRKFWKNDSFALEWIKSIYRFLGPLGNLIYSVLKKFIYFGFVIFISLSLTNSLGKLGVDLEHNKLFLWIYGYFAIFSLFRYFMADNPEKNLIFYDFFKMDARKIALSNIIFNNGLDIIAHIIVFFIFNGLIGLEPILIIKIHIMYFSSWLISNAVNSYFLKKGIKKADNNTILSIISIVFTLMVIAKDVIFKIHPVEFLNSNILFGVILVLAILSLFYMLKKVNYEYVFTQYSAAFEQLSYSLDTSDIAKKSSELKEEDYEISSKMVNKKLSGYPMLNEIFFQRHRRLIFRPIIVKAIFALLVLVVATIVPFAFGTALKIEGPENLFKSVIEHMPSLLPFTAYILFYHETIARTMFINCDEAFLQYEFYNRPEDLLQMFKLRFFKLLLWNSPALILFIIWLSLIGLFFKIAWSSILIVGIEMVALWVFFTVHILFVYYVFQPYNNKYEAKHPAYTIMNILVYIVSYVTMLVAPSGPMVAPISIGIALLYVIVALALVYSVSPKTFKVRISK